MLFERHLKCNYLSVDLKICNREYNSIKFNSLLTHLLISTEWL